MRVLIIGRGGREHAICWKIQQSPLLTKLWCAPGNPGIASVAECLPEIAINAIDDIVAFALANEVDLVIPGPELPLVLGLTDALEAVSIPCCGPSRQAARLEASKSFMKTICESNQISTAISNSFTDLHAAVHYIDGLTSMAIDDESVFPIVIKADGLADGKGVVIAHSRKQAIETLESFMRGIHGEAGKVVLIEEYLEGEEISFFVLCDGKTAHPFGTARDYKRAEDGDRGPNTGGMGSASPSRLCDAVQPDVNPFAFTLQNAIMISIIYPTLRAMRERGTPFKGILFAGIMVTGKGPELLEYNVRFGDPECQSILLRLKSDLLDLLYQAATGTLSTTIEWSDQYATSVVMAAPGYPESPQTGEIIVLPELLVDAKIFHSGTAMRDGNLVAAGGRVLTISALGDSPDESRDIAYQAISEVDFEGWYRFDIGASKWDEWD